MKGLASVLEFGNVATLIENKGTYNEGSMVDGATLTFEYPVTSDLTFNCIRAEESSYILYKGQTTIKFDYIEPAAPSITSYSPMQDETYYYTIAI